jgi:hypothetical protein
MERTSLDRYELRPVITKFEESAAPAGWQFSGREQQKKAIIRLPLSSRTVGLTRIESSDLRTAGFSRIFLARKKYAS